MKLIRNIFKVSSVTKVNTLGPILRDKVPHAFNKPQENNIYSKQIYKNKKTKNRNYVQMTIKQDSRKKRVASKKIS